jgi:vanillate O-demethylase monooxygenase subunit
MRAITGPVLDNTTAALRKAWHVVATSAEVGTEPVQVWLLGQPWCLVRPEGEAVAAWADRCPHRLAPLSAGRVRDGELECGYHGWRFARDGRCTAIPAQGDMAPPARAAVDVPWGIDERYGLIWLAPDPPVSDRLPFPEWSHAKFVTGISEIVRTPAGAAQLVDNFLDAAHFPFVHAASFGVPAAAEVRDQGVTRVGWQVETVFETWYREAGRIERQLLRKVGNASLSVRLRLDFPDTGQAIAILFCCTPERAGATRVYKLLARNDLDGDPARLEAFRREEDQILREDLAILERYDHESVPLDRTVELHTRADRLSLAWRAVMADLLAEAAASSDEAAVDPPPVSARDRPAAPVR